MAFELAHKRLLKRSALGVAPWLILLFLGSAAMGAWFLIGPALSHGRYYKVGFNRTTYEYTQEMLLLFIPYALALWAWRRGSRVPLWVLLGGAFVLHFLVLFAPLPQSQDFYQYLFYGRMQAVHHVNPYLVSPNTFWADPWFAWIRWSSQTSVYGPVWMLTTRAVATASGGSLAAAFVELKLVILALDLGIMWMLVAGARDRDDPRGAAGWGILAFAWNPLVLMTVPLGGTADVALAAAFVGAILARRRGRTWMATLLLSLGAMVKIYGVIGIVLHLVLIHRERGAKAALRNTAGAAGVAALASAPYWHGLATFGGLFKAASLTNHGLIGTIQRLLVPVVWRLGDRSPLHHSEVIVRVLGGALLMASVLWAIVRCRDERSLWYGALVVLTAYLYLTPWFLYWYTVAPIAMVAAMERNRLTNSILTFSGTSMILLGNQFRLENWIPQTLARYGPPLALFARSKARPTEVAPPEDEIAEPAPASMAAAV